MFEAAAAYLAWWGMVVAPATPPGSLLTVRPLVSLGRPSFQPTLDSPPVALRLRRVFCYPTL